MEMIGKALAGNAMIKDRENGKAPAKYDNPLTDFVGLMVAEVKAKQSIEDQKEE